MRKTGGNRSAHESGILLYDGCSVANKKKKNGDGVSVVTKITGNFAQLSLNSKREDKREKKLREISEREALRLATKFIERSIRATSSTPEMRRVLERYRQDIQEFGTSGLLVWEVYKVIEASLKAISELGWNKRGTITTSFPSGKKVTKPYHHGFLKREWNLIALEELVKSPSLISLATFRLEHLLDMAARIHEGNAKELEHLLDEEKRKRKTAQVKQQLSLRQLKKSRRDLEDLERKRVYLPNKKYTDEMFKQTLSLLQSGMSSQASCEKTLRDYNMDPDRWESYQKRFNKWNNSPNK